MPTLPVLLDWDAMVAIAAVKKSVAKRSEKGDYVGVAQRLGLIGCIEGPPDLATNYKKYLKKAARAKHRTR